MLKSAAELKQGDKFRFTWDSESVVRTAVQIGKTEIYAPKDNSNTMGHSKEGGEEVYSKYGPQVIIIEEKQ